MKRSSNSAFTLIEMLVVMVVIATLTGLVLAVNGLVQRKAAVTRATGEIAALGAACENYKSDNGGYPNSNKTEELDPRVDGNPTGADGEKYRDASEDLYTDLSGDKEPDKKPDGKPDRGKVYFEFATRRDMLDVVKDAEGGIQEVKYIQDPFGNPYGYSTAANKDERKYQEAVRRDASAQRPSPPRGYNPTFDLWSTGGSVSLGNTVDQAKWITNWK